MRKDDLVTKGIKRFLHGDRHTRKREYCSVLFNNDIEDQLRNVYIIILSFIWCRKDFKEYRDSALCKSFARQRNSYLFAKYDSLDSLSRLLLHLRYDEFATSLTDQTFSLKSEREVLVSLSEVVTLSQMTVSWSDRNILFKTSNLSVISVVWKTSKYICNCTPKKNRNLTGCRYSDHTVHVHYTLIRTLSYEYSCGGLAGSDKNDFVKKVKSIRRLEIKARQYPITVVHWSEFFYDCSLFFPVQENKIFMFFKLIYGTSWIASQVIGHVMCDSVGIAFS